MKKFDLTLSSGGITVSTTIECNSKEDVNNLLKHNRWLNIPCDNGVTINTKKLDSYYVKEVEEPKAEEIIKECNTCRNIARNTRHPPCSVCYDGSVFTNWVSQQC